ncbi:hypothetical protein HMPREF1624_01147 [Sporothrix schenckii ATCC 58251]|uniref:Protection of telomeres protein 1 ssDNA-binding domain-containing protein n=2 Tax=Sporothrix schenckii TaxID=29908 RepID=U7Q4M2_SPOS1|nr:hypothetical protein HMPREF1624_01147 [Sporothrix schenckii ATCC 58251]
MKATSALDAALNFQDMSDVINGNCKPYSIVSVQDYKMTVKLVDKSLETINNTLHLHIFQADVKAMPTFNLADVVVVKRTKVQKAMGSDNFSLLSNFATIIDVYRARTASPGKLEHHHQWLDQPNRVQYLTPSSLEHGFAEYLHKTINKNALPSIQCFEAEAEKSRHILDKRRELKDVADGMFQDIIVNVVADPYHTGSCSLLWVTDYTENCNFRNVDDSGVSLNEYHQVGDQNKYLTKFGGRETHQVNPRTLSNWCGPAGRFSMLVTCYAEHASIVSKEVKRGSWVELKNVHVRWYGGMLEGVMHEDLEYPERIKVRTLEIVNGEADEMDPRLQNALGRKKAFMKARQRNRKRKALPVADGPETGKIPNARQRRKLTRSAKPAQSTSSDVPLTNRPNEAIHCEYPDRALTSLSSMLDPKLYTVPGPEKLQLPFANIKFKTKVRVVDFVPTNLADFAVKRYISDIDMVKDDSDSDSLSEDDDRGNGAHCVWEWRFALCLEDASSARNDNDNDKEDNSSGLPPTRCWVFVDNFHGQMLLRSEASDLRATKEATRNLREKMFHMWGNLEEIKADAKRRAKFTVEATNIRTKAAAQQKEDLEKAARVAAKKRDREEQKKQAARQYHETNRKEIAFNGGNMKHYKQPEDDSDDDEDDNGGGGGAEANNAMNTGNSNDATQAPVQTPGLSPDQVARLTEIARELEKPVAQLTNRPFVCCLQQYGVRNTVYDNVEDEEDDECEYTWQRTFGMFGTTIRG